MSSGLVRNTVAAVASLVSLLGLANGHPSPVLNGVTTLTDRVMVHDTLAAHYVPMQQHVPPQHEDQHLRRRGLSSSNLTNVHDIYYIIELTVGNEKINVSVDTGSSDTWLVQQPYTCVSYYYPPPEKLDCGLGGGLKGNLSGGLIPDLVFGRAYTDGTFVQGYFGYEDVTIGGLTAKHQQLAIVNYTYWFGDGRISGLLGLAYPLMTSLDGSSVAQKPYDPVFFTLWKNKLVAPLFSVALSRAQDQFTPPDNSPSGGALTDTHDTSYLAFGGLPPVSIDETSWARAPIQLMSLLGDSDDFKTQERGLYIIIADAWVYGKTNHTVGTNGTRNVPSPVLSETLTKNTTQFPVLIDVGSSLSVLPRKLVEAVYASFDPPAKYMSENGLFYALCNATVPTFGVQIGNSTFYMAPEDLLRQSAKDSTGQYCRIGITDAEYGPYVLGVTFLTNVVAVFDIGNTEMRFASRTRY
ncbi:aspartic peptidase domain-containing protein [Cercophora scortea]|uniref:Aspartic peptidase domain-containing protein n=1 Tax=Cercophora scortea TaxID=314031 RepID=A0AAE0MI11_9PEZI|nr:aspartic peptidase domain-containing protein [Cercophora scortea]